MGQEGQATGKKKNGQRGNFPETKERMRLKGGSKDFGRDLMKKEDQKKHEWMEVCPQLKKLEGTDRFVCRGY